MKDVNRRTFLVATSAFGISAYLAACSSPGSPNPSATPGTVAWTQAVSPQLAYSNVLIAPSLSESLGLAVGTQLFDTGALAAQAMLGGQSDVAFAASQPLPALASKGAKLKLLASVVTSTNSLRILATSDIKSPEDLAGRRIGLPAGTVVEYAFERYCKQLGIDATSVSVVNVAPADMVPSMVSGSIDAFLWGQPTLANGLEAMGSKAHYLEPAVSKFFENNNYLLIRDDMPESKRESVENYIRSLMDANAYLKSDKADAADIVAKALKLDAATVTKTWSDAEFNWKCVIDYSAVSELDQVAEWLTARKVIPPGTQTNALWDSSYLQAVSPESVQVTI